MIFVDTGGWAALTSPRDQYFAVARRWYLLNHESLLTTDYVVDETLTNLRARGEHQLAIDMGNQFFQGNLSAIYYLTPEDIAATWDTFHRYADKDWSFTDCSSKVVMEKLGITHAFAFDQHFRQFGTVMVVP